MIKTDIKVGSVVESRCTKCRMVLDHVVVSMKASEIDKVKCNTCNGTHKYRDPSKPAAKRPSKPRKTSSMSAKKLNALQREWEECMLNTSSGDLINYSIEKQFNVGDKLKHPSFGDGSVQQLMGPCKMDVLFKTGHKLLIYNTKREKD